MIRLQNVVKDYGWGSPFPGRQVRALDGVTLDVSPGSAVGIIGLNGAGKSTLLRVLLGYVRPTSGEVRIAGVEARAYVERNGIAYVPERVAIPGRWTVREALQTYAMLGNLGTDAHERVDAALARLGLEEVAGRSVGALSKGILQRLGIAQALLGDRKLMVLDEPTDGLDPVWMAALRKIVWEWRAADPERIVVLASHNLPEVERLAERVLVLHEGRVLEELGPQQGGLEPRSLEERFLSLLSTREAVA